ncbi:MAG: ABC transporter permease [Gemmatimonadota bacterium]
MIGVLSVLTTVVLAGVVLVLGGYDPVQAAGAMIVGAFGSPSAIFSVTLVRAVPLILTGLAVAVAFRSGIWNIGAEGQLYAGAIAGVWVGLHAAGWPAFVAVPAVLGASAAGGALWALVPALMRIRLGVGEVITTILMNFVGLHLASYVVRGPLQEARGVFPQTDAIVETARLGVVVPGTRLHWGFVLAILLAVGAAFVLRRTRAGFRLRAVGASPGAARVAGRIDTDRVWTGAFLTSGAIAGVAGGVEVAGVTFALYEGLSPGWGYTAIAVALLAGLSPLGVLATGVLFGALEGGASAMQREAGVPFAWVGVVQALVILSVIALDQLRRRGAGSLISGGSAAGGGGPAIAGDPSESEAAGG